MIDLQKFCAHPAHIRPFLRQPFGHRGYRYGTNGHILVRVPSPADADAIWHLKAGDTIDHMFASLAVTEYGPLPYAHYGPTCPCCNGNGEYREAVCKVCRGSGDDAMQQGRDCRNCEGHGMVHSSDGELLECLQCNAQGFVRLQFPCNGIYFDSTYLLMLAALPNLVFGTQPDGKPAHFTFEGGEGLLNPLRSDKDSVPGAKV